MKSLGLIKHRRSALLYLLLSIVGHVGVPGRGGGVVSYLLVLGGVLVRRHRAPGHVLGQRAREVLTNLEMKVKYV